MSNRFMSPVAPFTLESLVARGQWAAAQNSRKKAAKPGAPKKEPINLDSSAKRLKPAL